MINKKNTWLIWGYWKYRIITVARISLSGNLKQINDCFKSVFFAKHFFSVYSHTGIITKRWTTIWVTLISEKSILGHKNITDSSMWTCYFQTLSRQNFVLLLTMLEADGISWWTSWSRSICSDDATSIIFDYATTYAWHIYSCNVNCLCSRRMSCQTDSEKLCPIYWNAKDSTA